MVLSRVSAAVLCAVLLGGCGSSKPKFEVAEVVTVEAQALEDVRATPTTFSIDPSEDPAVWTRAKIFFENYAGGKPVYTSTEMKSSQQSSSPVKYRVRKRWQNGGFQYVVTAQTPGGATPQDRLMLYAKNFARFLQSGYLELSLVQ